MKNEIIKISDFKNILQNRITLLGNDYEDLVIEGDTSDIDEWHYQTTLIEGKLDEMLGLLDYLEESPAD